MGALCSLELSHFVEQVRKGQILLANLQCISAVLAAGPRTSLSQDFCLAPCPVSEDQSAFPWHSVMPRLGESLQNKVSLSCICKMLALAKYVCINSVLCITQ